MIARFTLSLLSIGLLPFLAPGQTPATIYLQSASDRSQHTVDVYTDADAPNNHFAYRGEFHDPSHLTQVPAMDEISSSASCHSGITCITAMFNPLSDDYGGWYFLNGILGPTDRQPTANWGSVSDAGYDLTGATTLTFWAKGLRGGEKVHLFAFGVGNTQAPFEPYPDSSLRVPPQASAAFQLTQTWTQYQIDLTGVDIHYVLGGFGWVVSAAVVNNVLNL